MISSLHALVQLVQVFLVQPRLLHRTADIFCILLQVGDGTTSVVLLAGELMKMCKPFVEDGVHPQVIIKAYRKATSMVSGWSEGSLYCC